MGSDKIDFFSDLNLDTADSEISITDKLQIILDNRFGSGEKTKIRETGSKLNFSCPYCGDSATDVNKKRGNIYTNNWWYKCYNCSTSKPVSQLFLDFNESVPNFVLSGEGFSNTRARVTDIYGLEKFALDRTEVMKAYGLIECELNKTAYKYLDNRVQLTPTLKNVFAYQPRINNLYIFNLTSDGNKIIGLQIRYLDESFIKKTGLRFNSRVFSEICKKMEISDFDEEELKFVDRYSLIYNILRIDTNLPTYVFEGAIDANHVPNSVASLSSDVKIQLPNPYYIYDNSLVDKTGFKKAMELLNHRQNVFLWRKFLRDYPDFESYKDLNDIYRYGNRNFDHKILYNYFSNEPFDIMYL